jgi:hypothetical protein
VEAADDVRAAASGEHAGAENRCDERVAPSHGRRLHGLARVGIRR